MAVLGIGNQFRSDDAAGVRIARALSRRLSPASQGQVLIVEAGHAPENATGEIRHFAPQLVLMIDAAEMGAGPGMIQWIPEEAIDGMSASTHSLPLSMLARYLRLELDCQVALLGIQPGSNEVGETLSPDVSQAVDEIVEELSQSLTR